MFSSTNVLRGSIVLGAASVLTAAGVWFNYGGPSAEMDEELTHVVQRGDLIVSVTEQGTLESSNNTEIRNKVRGFSVVTEVVEVGEVVKKGEVLVKLDTKAIEDQLSTARTNVNSAEADLARSEANLETNEIAKKAYLEGRLVSQQKALQRAKEIAGERLAIARKNAKETRKLYQMSYMNRQELEASDFAVTQHLLELSVKQNEIDVLNEFTSKMQEATLEGNRVASEKKAESDKAALEEEKKRMRRLEQELKDCVIYAPRDGLVIYPSAAAWKQAPDIDEGASVRMDQVLLLMPDLENMQIKVGVHESVVDKIRTKMKAEIRLPDQDETLIAEVSKVANVTKPAGWWTGNVVKYDTIIKLPSASGLKPGMTAEVKIIMAVHNNVVKIPVAAVVELDGKSYCWVVNGLGIAEKRELKLGDSDEIYIVVEDGIDEGERVVLNPLARVEEAQTAAQKLIDKTRSYTN